MAEALRQVEPEWLAFYALTKDEPLEFALDYLATAHSRLGEAMTLCRDAQGKLLVPPEAMAEMSGVHLFLIALAMAADPSVKTAANLRLTPRRGRPNRNIVKINDYRKAARRINALKPEGYEAAVNEIAKESGLDRSELEAWAAHIERQEAAFGLTDK